jgi:hypothetical protein
MSMIIMRSDPTWTIIRFLAPRDGAAKQRLRSGFFGTDTIGWTITRADIAHFLTGQLHDALPQRRASDQQLRNQPSGRTVRSGRHPRPKAEPSADSLGDSTLTERVVVRHSYGARGFPRGHLGVLSGARSGSWYETAPCRKPTVLRIPFAPQSCSDCAAIRRVIRSAWR